MSTHTSDQLNNDIARYRRLLLHPESWETEALLELISHVKIVHAALDSDIPASELENYQRLVNDLDERLRAIANTYPDIFEVYSEDWTRRVNILEVELGWDIEASS